MTECSDLMNRVDEQALACVGGYSFRASYRSRFSSSSLSSKPFGLPLSKESIVGYS